MCTVAKGALSRRGGLDLCAGQEVLYFIGGFSLLAIGGKVLFNFR